MQCQRGYVSCLVPQIVEYSSKVGCSDIQLCMLNNCHIHAFIPYVTPYYKNNIKMFYYIIIIQPSDYIPYHIRVKCYVTVGFNYLLYTISDLPEIKKKSSVRRLHFTNTFGQVFTASWWTKNWKAKYDTPWRWCQCALKCIAEFNIVWYIQ